MPTCFVIMGFGEKNDLATGRKLNLDATYKHVIKPAVEGAKYTCIRADEVRHSGVICSTRLNWLSPTSRPPISTRSSNWASAMP